MKVEAVRLSLVLALGLFFVAAFAGDRVHAASASDALATEIRELAKDLNAAVKKVGDGAIAIGAFNGDTRIGGSQGPRIQQALAQALKAEGAAIDNDGRYEITGRYQPFDDPKSGLLVVRLSAEVVDRDSGESILKKGAEIEPRLIWGPETVPAMLGISGLSPKTDDPKAIDEAIRNNRDAPPFAGGAVVRSSSASPFAMEVLVKRGDAYEPLDVTIDDHDRAIVEVPENAIFAVRLTNDSDFEASIDLRIDGISVFAFGDSGDSRYVAAPHSAITIPGWYKNETTTTEFKRVGFPDSAAVKLHLAPSTDIGLLTASFAYCWETDAQRPPDEPKTTTRAAGFGEDVEFKVKSVTRTLGKHRDTVVVRYER